MLLSIFTDRVGGIIRSNIVNCCCRTTLYCCFWPLLTQFFTYKTESSAREPKQYCRDYCYHYRSPYRYYSTEVSAARDPPPQTGEFAGSIVISHAPSHFRRRTVFITHRHSEAARDWRDSTCDRHSSKRTYALRCRK